MKKITLLFLLVCAINLFSFAQHNDVLFTGRFDFSDPNEPVFSHVSSSIKANFSGTGISATLSSAGGTSYIYVIVDGQADPENRMLLKIRARKANSFTLASNLPNGPHTIELVKVNQYDTKVKFHGFTVDDGNLLAKPEQSPLKIEFYGDSNPAGHSTWDVADGGAIIDNGGYFTYPGITSRLLGADYHNISMGGAGVTSAAWRNLVDVHHLIHMDDDPSGSNLWNFENFAPDAVVINLGANDYYSSADKNDIKSAWKDFITKNLRVHHPNAHIVLANSYGWAFNEPADYVHEAINELKASGDNNVSYVRFPWLWGQEHAVVNEHAGFANILATHLANELNLSQPQLSDLSSFAPRGELYNASFEKSTLDGVADGWRSHAAVTLVEGASDAVDGENYLEVYNTAWVNFANDASPGDEFTVTGWMSGAKNGDLGKLKLEFKDQGQNTISAVEGLQTVTTEWQQFSTTAVAPEGTWAVWVVLVAEKRDVVYFDDLQISMTANYELKDSESSVQSISKVDANEMNVVMYPNPSNGKYLTLENLPHERVQIAIYNLIGKAVFNTSLESNDKHTMYLPEQLDAGLYNVVVESSNGVQSLKLLIN